MNTNSYSDQPNQTDYKTASTHPLRKHWLFFQQCIYGCPEMDTCDYSDPEQAMLIGLSKQTKGQLTSQQRCSPAATDRLPVRNLHSAFKSTFVG